MSSNSRQAFIVLVTGMSGAGKTTVVQALEDEGFFCIDNLPPALANAAVNECLAAPDSDNRIALVLDARTGALLTEVPAAKERLTAAGHHVDVLFLDALDEVLIRRYSETRRKHPVEKLTVIESIASERQSLTVIRGLATRVIDTSNLSRQELRHLVVQNLDPEAQRQGLSLTLMSFGFKFGLPAEADLVFDVRHLQNPFFVPALKSQSGRDEAVRKYVLHQPDTQEFLHRIDDLLRYLTPLYQREGKSYLTVAIGCTGGRHRSVAIAEALGSVLEPAAKTWAVSMSVRHRDIDRV